MDWLKKILNGKVDWYDKLIYFELCYGQGLVHLTTLMDIIGIVKDVVITAGIIQIAWNIPGSLLITLGIITAIVYAFLRFGIGHLEHSKGLVDKSNNLRNKYNPQLKFIVSKLEELEVKIDEIQRSIK